MYLMNKLEEARNLIHTIDEQMIELFVKRMQAAKMVAEYKRENHLPVTDEKREQELIAKNLKVLNQEELNSYYLTFFDGVLAASKAYQEDLLK